MDLRTILVMTSVGFATVAGDVQAQSAQTLHEESCTQCHGTTHYTRKDRKVNSRQRLDAQVERCQKNVGAQWNATQVQSVAEYLDHQYYKFHDTSANSTSTDSATPK